jgi:transcription elongation factor GreB
MRGFFFFVPSILALTLIQARPMSKAFTKETDADEDDGDGALPPIPPGAKNYLTPLGAQALRSEFAKLMDEERPKTVEIVSWAAKNGDRSENGDYIYGKKRLREIDRRIRFLTKRLEIAEVVDPAAQPNKTQIFFGATVRYENGNGDEREVTIVGIDEAEPLQNRISWVSPVARALLKARVGEVVSLPTPAGQDELEVLEIRYPQA